MSGIGAFPEPASSSIPRATTTWRSRRVPLAFGETVVRDRDVPMLQTDFGPLRVITPTQSIMDRLAAYVHWNDRQALDQAVMVARRQRVDWNALKEWARREAVDAGLIDKVRRSAGLA